MQPPPAPDHKLKTLVVDFSKGYGGASTRVLTLLRYLPSGQAGLAGLTDSPVVQEARSLDVPVYTVGSSKVDVRIFPRLVNIIQEGEYQVVDTHNIQAKFWGSLAAVRTGAALVSTIHSWYAHEHGQQSRRGRFYTALELRTNRHLGAYITVSAKDRDMLLKSGVAPEDVALIYNAVNIEAAAIPDQREHFQSEFGFPADAVICTAVGRMVKVKGYDILIEAFARLANRIPNVRGIIVGDGELLEEYRQKIYALGLTGCVQLAGYRSHDEVLRMVKASDIFVMPSRYEGTPIALLEAAALGRAIIASHAGGIPELVEEGQQALLVPAEDPAALAEALAQLAQNPTKRSQLGQLAQQRVQENFNTANMLKKTRQTYWKAWQKTHPG